MLIAVATVKTEKTEHRQAEEKYTRELEQHKQEVAY